MPDSQTTLERRVAFIERNTKETKIQLHLSLDGGPLDLLPTSNSFPDRPPASAAAHEDGYRGDARQQRMPDQDIETHASQNSASQQIWIWTGIGFLDHMLHAWAKHAGWSLRVRCRGDLISECFFIIYTIEYRICGKTY